MEIWEWTSQLLTCNLNFENSFWICGSGCNNFKLNFENRNCCRKIWEWTSHYSTCKLNFENQNYSMEIWEWTSQQLPCKLNFLQAEFRKFNLEAEFQKSLFGCLEVVVAPAN